AMIVKRFRSDSRMNDGPASQLRALTATLAWTFAFCGPVHGQGVHQLSADRVLATHAHATIDGAPVVSAVAIDGEGRRLATAGDDHLVRIWNADDGSLVRELRTHTDWVRAISF